MQRWIDRIGPQMFSLSLCSSYGHCELLRSAADRRDERRQWLANIDEWQTVSEWVSELHRRTMQTAAAAGQRTETMAQCSSHHHQHYGWWMQLKWNTTLLGWLLLLLPLPFRRMSLVIDEPTAGRQAANKGTENEERVIVLWWKPPPPTTTAAAAAAAFAVCSRLLLLRL